MPGNAGQEHGRFRTGLLTVTLCFLGFSGLSGCAGGAGSSGTSSPHSSPPPPSSITITITSPANPDSVNVQTYIGFLNFTATVNGDSQNGGVNWTLAHNGTDCTANAALCGGLSNKASSSGTAITYFAPLSAPNPPTVTLTATSATDKSKTAVATITVTPAVSVTFTTPTSTHINLQAEIGTQRFTAMVANDSKSIGVNWTMTHNGSDCTTNAGLCGSLGSTASKSGVPITYRAPTNVPTPATVTLTATSVEDPNKSATATITVTPAVSVGFSSPANPNVNVQAEIGTQIFTALVANDSQSLGVNWTMMHDGSDCTANAVLCGSLSKSGVSVTYKAPISVPTPATVTLTATSVEDVNKSATATIAITPAISVSVSAANPTDPINLTTQVTATVAHDLKNQGVNWTMTFGGNPCTVVVCGNLSSFSSTSGTPVTYTAPAAIPNPAQVKLIATSVADLLQSNSTSVTVTLNIIVSVASVSVPPRTNYPLKVNQVQAFSATVQNDPNGLGVSWTISTPGCSGNSSCGLLSGPTSTGVTYNAPAALPAGQNPAVFTLTATSVFDPAQSASATIPVSQGIPATTLGWFEVPNSNIQPICPTDPVIQGFDGCKGVISAWSGGVADTKRNRLLFTGGGHENYYGNEVYALDLNSASANFLTVSHITNPTLPLGSVPFCQEDWGNPSALPPIPSAPAPRETYGNLAYAANPDQLWLFGGAPATNFEPCRSNGMWTLDLTALTWTRLDTTLTIVSPAGAGTPGNITLTEPSAINPPTQTDINYSDYDPQSGLVYSYLADADILTSYNPATNTLTALQWGQIHGQTNYHANGVFDPKRNIFLIVGLGTMAWFNLNTTPPAFTNYSLTAGPTACGTSADPNNPAIQDPFSPGLAYDSKQDRIVGWGGGNTIYIIDTTHTTDPIPTLSCTTVVYPGGPAPVQNPNAVPTGEQKNGTFGRFRYFPSLNIFALVNDWQENAFTLRLTP